MGFSKFSLFKINKGIDGISRRVTSNKGIKLVDSEGYLIIARARLNDNQLPVLW